MKAVKFVEQGHVRVGPEVITDPAYLVTRFVSNISCLYLLFYFIFIFNIFLISPVLFANRRRESETWRTLSRGSIPPRSSETS